ncbi:centrosomal protein of 162 kDa [Pholidichthys leucotaenia]
MAVRLSKEELDAQFEQFMKESVSDDSVDLGGSDKQLHTKSSLKPTVSRWQDDEQHDEGSERELAKHRFIKKKKSQPENNQEDSLRKSQYGQEEDEELGEIHPKEEGLKTAFLFRGSAETEDSLKTQAVNMTVMGLDTLEEEEEKTRFFAQLEAGASSSIDYSRLNRELDSTGSTVAPSLRKAAEAVGLSGGDGDYDDDDDQRKTRVTLTPRQSPVSPHYTEDFEDEESAKEPVEEMFKVPPALAKVSLYDSVHDTGGEDRGKEMTASANKGQSYEQSGGSEVEALQEAYRQIHTVEGSSSVEEKERIIRPATPFSPPHHGHQSLQPASTYESDLPTAEELMRPIRPKREDIRGFTLQPVSAVKHNQRKTSQPPERTLREAADTELLERGKTGPVAGKRGVSGPAGHGSISPDPSNHNFTRSIRKEVERLMQDHDKAAYDTALHTSKTRKQPLASHGSTGFHASVTPMRKPSVVPVRGRTAASRAASTYRSSRMSKPTAAAAKPQSSVSCLPQHPQRAISTKSQATANRDSEGVNVSIKLVESVQSLVAVLQQQMDANSHQEAPQEVGELQETRLIQRLPHINNDEDSSALEVLRVQLAVKERELQGMKEGAEELNSLRQQNYLLQSKLRSAEEAAKKMLVEAADPATQEKLLQLGKEIQEQETLIKGYQQENEKLCLQLKAQQAESKANEELMFKENQRLLSELAFTRKQLNEATRPMANVFSADHTQRITDLLAQINALQQNEAKLCEDIDILKREKQNLEADLQLTKNERDVAKARLISSSGDQTSEVRALEARHTEEVAKLKRQWFAENQALRDKDAGRLQAATAEIHQLREQVEKLKMEVDKRRSEQQRKARVRSAETKKMQDLERQVKELEQILRQKNPNSLPALIYAAATAAAGPGDMDSDKTSSPSRTTALLERRVQRLELELESHDEESKRSLRAMEQQFHRIKLCYEQRISELEQQLEHEQQVGSSAKSELWTSKIQSLEEELKHVTENHQEKEKALQEQMASLQQQLKHKLCYEQRISELEQQLEHEQQVGSSAKSELWTSKIQSLEEELKHVRENHQEKEKALQEQMASLQQQLKHKVQSSPGRYQRQAEMMFGLRIKSLTQELATKTRRIQELSCTVERLQKERKNMLSAPKPRSEPRSKGTNLRRPRPYTAEEACAEETFPASQCDKTYQPTVFSGSHISEVLQENEALKQRVELLQQQSEQEKTDATSAKRELWRLKEHFEEQLSSMKAEHLRALDRLRATHALEHSSSKVAELTNMLSTQEIELKRLQGQLRELEGSKEELLLLRRREEALQQQLSRLLQELKEAKEAQRPEVKLLCSLEKKILNMELRQENREKELQQVIVESRQTSEAGQLAEVERWKCLAQDKSRELEAFRLELDSILDILRDLQQQGVVLPTSGRPITDPVL